MDTEAAIRLRSGTAIVERSTTASLLEVITRRIWLPQALYDAVPWIYIATGSAALVGGLLLPEWAWPLPYLVLLGLACLHLGLGIASLRHRQYARRNPDAAS